LFFHGKDGTDKPRAMGGLKADTLNEVLTIMKAHPPMPAHDDLAGVWCVTFAAVGDAGPEHPATCQYLYRLSADGRISDPNVLQ
jgi:hypothetical protein